MWTRPTKSIIGGGVLFALVLYVAYLFFAVGYLKSSILALLILDLSVLGMVLLGMASGSAWDRYLEPIWNEYGFRNPFNDRTKFWFLAILLFTSAVGLMASVVFGKVYLIILCSIVGAIAFYALINSQD